MDRSLRRLEALLLVADRDHMYLLSGNGDVIEPDEPVLAIGSGGDYARASALALYRNTNMSAEEIVKEEGIDLFVIGTLAIKEPETFEEIIYEFPQRVILAVDARGGKVAIGGWKEESALRPEDLALKYDQKPIWGYLYTNIERDGTLEGVDVEPYREFKKHVKKPLIASGGVASLEDVYKLMDVVEGVVVGKAIYEGKINLKELL